MQPEDGGWALASTTTDGSTATEGARIVRPACTPGTEISEMPTWDPISGTGGEARPGTGIRSQPDAPAGARSGRAAGLCAKATRSVPSFPGASKFTGIPWPAAPAQLPDPHMVLVSPSTAA